MRFEWTNIFADIDPRLQRLIQRRRRGLSTPLTASTEVGEIAVIAKVNDIQAWRSLSEVREGTEIINTASGDVIVTARVPVSRLQFVRTSHCVVSLQASQALQLTVDNFDFEEVLTTPNFVQLDSTIQGRDVVVGVIDVGCDFVHKNFRHPDGSTRILALWDQDGCSEPDSPFGYGKVYRSAEINQALQANDPYLALGYSPGKLAHGTHVMDIATGNGNGTGNPGIAPEADIVFVHFSNGAVEAVLANGGSAVDNSLGDTTELVEAVDFIFGIADERPCAINISLALHGGPHDGTALVEQSINALVSDRPNRAVVIAAGNSYDRGIHASGTVPQDGFTDLHWDIPRGHRQYKAMELWYSGADKFLLDIIPPDGETLVSLRLGENGEIVDEDDNTVIYLSHRFCDPNNGDNMIGVFMESKLPGGVWTLRLHGVEVSNGNFHAWIEREDGSQTSFIPPHDNTHTVNSIGCGQNIIMVGSYDPTKPNQPISYFSSSGPTRDGRQKPDFIAPGQNIWAASSLTETKSSRKTGTSMSSPVVTGIVALMLSEARDRNITLDINQIHQILRQSAQNNPPQDPSQKARYGYGPINIQAAISAVRAM
ncbi:S8 family peptidase [Rivularia sp. UHCC 0363]|uniref:S8 family peptidase n=1 Tax=Rivularia sp. UHCC 0363 TaxID=3110244 RepID=UPI002B1F4D51|nr:S8 family peptidase [Rivularia sp. UHCC 0363]MEA5595409.1 S8 family peptidase [Rivularia sp. UHCC 0363]